MAMSAAFSRSAGRLGARRLPAALALGATIGLAAIALQLRYGLLGDVSWLITLDEKWLDGATPYLDFIEINPPASLMLYWPAVALARLIGVAPEFTVAAFGFVSIAASLGVSAAILSRAGLAERIGPVGFGLALAALAILPGQSFDERDQLAVLYGLPFLALAAARVANGAVDPPLALLAGLGAGAMAIIKPPYALVALAVMPYLIRRLGFRATLICPELYVAAAAGLIYVALVAHYFPHYVETVLPLGVALYAPIREPLLALLTGPGALIIFVLGVATTRIAGRDLAAPLVAVPALGALGALAAFLVQGKGWLYQIYPALTLMTLAAGFALDLRPPCLPRIALGALAALVTALAVVSLWRWPLPIAFAAAACAGALARIFAGRARLEEMGVAAVFGAACGLFAMDGIRTPAHRARARQPRAASERRGDFGEPRLQPPDGAGGWRRLGAERAKPLDHRRGAPHDRRASRRSGDRGPNAALHRRRSRPPRRRSRQEPAGRLAGREARHALPPMGLERPEDRRRPRRLPTVRREPRSGLSRRALRAQGSARPSEGRVLLGPIGPQGGGMDATPCIPYEFT